MRISDWSSDVCSSDLRADFLQPKPVASDGDDGAARFRRVAEAPVRPRDPVAELDLALGIAGEAGRADQARRAVGAAEAEERSEARRVGQECVRTFRYRWSSVH